MSAPALPLSQAPTPPPAPPARPRRPYRASLAAHGEPMVWLTGGALATALAMIAGLLAFIFAEGLTTFWPSPVVKLVTNDGQSYLGEVWRAERFRPQAESLEELPPAAAESARQLLAAGDGAVERRLLRTGNYDLTNTHFQWVEAFRMKSEDNPQWALVVERLAWGRFYGEPKAFLLDGQTSATEPEAIWNLYQQHHRSVRERFEERKSLETHGIGRLNAKSEDARLHLKDVELHSGRESVEWRSASASLAETQAAAEAQIAEIRSRIEQLNRENDRFQLLMNTADGQEATLALAEIVRAYPANRLSIGGKFGVYFSRWREFLLDEPREANSEGGVFPAIFGTVVMTLIMTLAVVPFGVLAALYLREYAKGGLVVSAVRIAINNLAGVPSIVFGVFGLGFFCYILGHYIDAGPSAPWRPGPWYVLLGVTLVTLATAIGISWFIGGSVAGRRRGMAELALVVWLACGALTVMSLATTPFFSGFFAARLPNPTYGKGGLIWASLTLALLTLPVVIVATEEALAAVPRSMREGSYACGASKWQTIRRIVLPRAMPGVMTGMILAMARGAGEVAPLMLVGALKLAPDLPLDTTPPFLHPERSFMHLGFHVFDLGFQSPNSEAAKPMVFTTTLLLISLIALLNVIAIWIRTRLRKRYAANQF